MDVLYCWKDMPEDLKAGRIGWLRSGKDRLAEFQEGFPGYIWVFRTPRGMKGKLQLLARLAWSDRPIASASAPKGVSLMHYDASHPHSVWFDGAESGELVDRVSDWTHLHFPDAVRANFSGVNGQQALRGTVLQELVTIAKLLGTHPFRTIASPTA